MKTGIVPLRLGVANGFKGIYSTVIKLIGYPRWNRQIEASILFTKMDLKKEHIALEVGCGTAALTAELAFRGMRIVGLDIDSSTVATAHKRHGKVAEFVVADASKLPFRRGAFNHILSLSAIEHFLDIEGFLHNSYKCLRSNGELLIVTDAKPIPASNLWRSFPKFLMKKDVKEMMQRGLSLNQILLATHQKEYNVRHYFDCKHTSMFEHAGFRIEACERFMGGVWACLFQAYLLVKGLAFTNTTHTIISMLLNPFAHTAKASPTGVGVCIKCVKD